MNLRKALFVFIAVVWYHPTFAQRQAKEPFDVVHHRFDVHLEDTTDQIQVSATITIVMSTDDQNDLVFDLVNKLDSSEYGMQITSVKWNGAETGFTHQSNSLNIGKPSPIQRSDTVSLTIKYHGIAEDGLIIGENKFGSRTFFADHWPNRASYWLPVVDHPSEKATCEFVVTAPDHYRVVANGDLQGVQSAKGYKTTHWAERRPIPAKVMVIGVADFVQKVLDDDSLITAWLYPRDAERGVADFSATAEIFELLSNYIGEYPFSKLDQVESTTKYGGMENAGNIFYSETDITGSKLLNATIAHEIAHQWFGNSVSESDWEHVWLSEGIATFFDYWYTRRTYGLDSIKTIFKADKIAIQAYLKLHPDATILQREYTHLEEILNPMTYQKAARMLWILNNRIGDTAMQQIFRGFYQKYQFANAQSQDFVNVVNEVTGQDHAKFFEQWLTLPGLVDVTYTWKYKKEELRFSITQNGPVVYEFDLDIGIKYSRMKFEVKKVRVDKNEQTIIIPMTTEPASLVIDPLHLILGEIKRK